MQYGYEYIIEDALKLARLDFGLPFDYWLLMMLLLLEANGAGFLSYHYHHGCMGGMYEYDGRMLFSIFVGEDWLGLAGVCTLADGVLFVPGVVVVVVVAAPRFFRLDKLLVALLGGRPPTEEATLEEDLVFLALLLRNDDFWTDFD